VEGAGDYYRTLLGKRNVLDKTATNLANINVLKFIGLKSIDEFVGLTYMTKWGNCGFEGHADIYKKT